MTEFDKLKAMADPENSRVELDTNAVVMAMMQAMKAEVEKQSGDKIGRAISTKGTFHLLVGQVVTQLVAGILTSAYEANAHSNPYYAMGRDAAELVEVCRMACLHALNHVIKEKGGK